MGHKRPRIPPALRAGPRRGLTGGGKPGKPCGLSAIVSRPAPRTTDTLGMKRTIVIVGLALFSGWLAAAVVSAGDHCGRCGGTAAGMETPCGNLGCGPRYWGAVHDEPPWPDPCDACGRWIGCHGSPQGPEMFAPWQLPPGRGFTPPCQLGYGPTRGVCEDAGACKDCAVGTLKGFRSGPLWWF